MDALDMVSGELGFAIKLMISQLVKGEKHRNTKIADIRIALSSF